MSDVTKWRKILRYEGEGDGFSETEAWIAVEYPLTIRVNGQEFATIVCTPRDLEQLVIGFLAAEGVIRGADEIKSLSISEKRGFAYVELVKSVPVDEWTSKRFIGSCCGKSRQFYFQNDVKTAKTVMSRMEISIDRCFALMQELNRESVDFSKTGGLHNAALCSADQVLVVCSDIGRHNALDKIYGYCLEHHIPLGDKLIAFSGRISSEVLLKVSKIGVGILLSSAAPTDLALDLAEDLGITTVGFVRDNHMNVYTHAERIVGS